MAQQPESKGIRYAPGVPGKYLFRVREEYVAGPAADLVRARRVGALKLDLVLRGLALLPAHAEPHEPGYVLRHRGRLSYEALHDLCRDRTRFSFGPNPDTPETVDKKRTWVREQLQELERRSLVRRQPSQQRRRPDIIVLRDRGDGEPYDDPTGKDGFYITIAGAVLASEHYPRWGAPAVAAYLCAMKADRDARLRQGNPDPPGSATWFRQADWFNNTNPNIKLPDTHIAYPFSTMTIQRGLRELRDSGLLETRRTTRSPQTGRRFTSGPRTIYTNRFNKLNPTNVPSA